MGKQVEYLEALAEGLAAFERYVNTRSDVDLDVAEWAFRIASRTVEQEVRWDR